MPVFQLASPAGLTKPAAATMAAPIGRVLVSCGLASDRTPMRLARPAPPPVVADAHRGFPAVVARPVLPRVPAMAVTPIGAVAARTAPRLVDVPALDDVLTPCVVSTCRGAVATILPRFPPVP